MATDQNTAPSVPPASRECNTAMDACKIKKKNFNIKFFKKGSGVRFVWTLCQSFNVCFDPVKEMWNESLTGIPWLASQPGKRLWDLGPRPGL